MMNPAAFATPEQMQKMAQMQQLTKNIKYIVHTDDAANKVEITLQTEDPDAAQLIPQIREGLVASATQMLYQMFAMNGERV